MHTIIEVTIYELIDMVKTCQEHCKTGKITAIRWYDKFYYYQVVYS